MTREQFENLAAYYADFRYVRFRYCSLRLFGSLTPRQREIAFGESGLPYAALMPAQQELFGRVTRTTRPYYLAGPPGDTRRTWAVYLREEQNSGEPDGSASIYYGWQGTDGTGCILPSFVPVDPSTPLDTVPPMPPERWKWVRGSMSPMAYPSLASASNSGRLAAGNS